MKQYITDLHIHSKYSRATSKHSDLENLHTWAKIKGIDIVGTGDFTHPAWFAELQEKLEPNGHGLFSLRNETLILPELLNANAWQGGSRKMYFMLTSEISCIYSKNGRVRRIHVCVCAPSFEAVAKINSRLSEIGNLKADGRPILGLDAAELARIVLDADDRCLIIPAHIWTPWFSLFGSKSGFDTIAECFEEVTPYIYAVETGLSSDPLMNWRLSALDTVMLVSNSDAHSPQNLGREANVFSLNEPSYFEIAEILKTRDIKKFVKTIEFFPEEGKYHLDGHAKCNISFLPAETKREKEICPVCKKKLTVGVLHRVDDLADRAEEAIDRNQHVPFASIVPLADILAEVLGKGKNTQTVQRAYFRLIEQANNEFSLLVDFPLNALATDSNIKEAIARMRSGNIVLHGGYDGIFGTVKIFEDNERV